MTYLNNITSLLRVRHAYFFRTDKSIDVVAVFRLFYLYSLGLHKASDVFELAARINANFF